MSKEDFWKSLSEEEKQMFREGMELFDLKYEGEMFESEDGGVKPFQRAKNPDNKCWWKR